jgi:hypothetical protein
MGIRAVPAASALVPKAVCPSCSRPVAVFRTGVCAYCATPIPGAERTPAPRQELPVELTLMLEPRARESSSGFRWIVRLAAVAAVAMGVVALLGPCARS